MGRQPLGMLALGLGGFVLFGMGMAAGWKPCVVAGSLTAGFAGAWSMLRCQKRGIFRTRHGPLRRSDHPAWFRFHLSCGWTAILLWTLGGLLFGLGVFGPR